MMVQSVALVWACCAAAHYESNKFGIGAYDIKGGVQGPAVSVQLPWARNLTGQGGRVLLYAGMTFALNGNTSSCNSGCTPSAEDTAAISQAYSLGLRPVVRVGQWPRTIRDFADDLPVRRNFTSLARAYRTFASSLPLPPDGISSLDVVVLNEPNVCGEWLCKSAADADGGPGAPAAQGGVLTTEVMALESGACIRDILAALRTLPRLRLSVAPIAYTAPANCSCEANQTSPNPTPDWNVPTSVAFIRGMLTAAPDLYTHAEFFSAHPYPFNGRPFSDPLGRAGATHYRAELNASGRPGLPVAITEAGWSSGNASAKAASIVAAYEEEWLRDARVESVMPFLLTAANGTEFAERGWPWVLSGEGEEESRETPHSYTLQFNTTRQLRCRIGVGGPC